MAPDLYINSYKGPFDLCSCVLLIYVLTNFCKAFLVSSSGPKDPMSLCHGVASVRPSTVFKMLLLRHFSTDSILIVS